MANEQKMQQLLIQVSRAREALGNALGLIQDLDVTDFESDKVTALLAASVRALFLAGEEHLQSAAPISSAMQNLRDILQMMQDVKTADPKLQAATTTVARILAILFPVFRELSAPTAAPSAPPSKPLSAPAPVAQDERRSAPRKAIEVEIGLQSDSNFFTGFSTDISSGGLFVATYDVPEKGHLINLNFHLPNGPVMSVDGEVCWIREYNERTPDIPPGAGVRFLHLSAEDAAAINSYMQSVQPLFFD